MKELTFIILTILNLTNGYGQTVKEFDVKEEFNKNIFNRKNKNSFDKHYSSFYNDEFYLCAKTCNGEFGGTVKFRNKKTGIEYLCGATCPVAVNRINDKYIVTTTLAHGSGMTRIIEILNPDSLEKFPKESEEPNFQLIRTKSKSTVKTVLDTVGVLTLASFIYKNQLYYITTDFTKTYISKIENSKFTNIELVSNESLWTYEPEIILTNDNHYVVFYNNSKAKGYIDIFENKVNVVRHK